MDDTEAMGAGETGSDLCRDIDGLRDIERTPCDFAREGIAIEASHRDEQLAIDFLDIVNGADIGMAREGGGARFVEEAMPALLGEGFAGQELQRDGTLEARVFGAIDLAHAAFADASDDAIAANGVAGVHGLSAGGGSGGGR